MKSSLSMVKCLLLFTRFRQDEILSWDEYIVLKDRDEISSRYEKKKKMCKNFILESNSTMSMFLIFEICTQYAFQFQHV